MKKIVNILILCLAVIAAPGCLNEYLDRAPDAGLSEAEVFGKYANFKSYFYSVYGGANFNIRCHYPLHACMNSQKITLEELTDMCDKTRIQRAQEIRLGNGSSSISVIGYEGGDSNFPLNARVPNTWKCIRVCNMAIDKASQIVDCTPAERNDLLGQAYFVRAFCHFELFRLYGTIPYVDKVLGADDEWDITPEDDYTFLKKCAADYQTAYDYFDLAGKVRRDPASGAGHLADADQDKPNGVAALAMKGRVLLYAASPLNNPEGDVTRWQEAAEANAVALNTALAQGYALLTKANYSRNFYGTNYSNEQLWGWSYGSMGYNNSKIQSFVGYPFSNNAYSASQCPTQNFVDKFETADGWPLNTEAQRAAATAAGKYNEQDPYKNRDPRFENAVIYNQCQFQGYSPASIYLNADGSKPDGSLLTLPPSASDGVSETFYYERKRTGALSQKGNTSVNLTDPIIRLAEVYLNYAEAANEAWGPDGKSESATLTAVEAVNVVRDRVEMPAVLPEYCSGKDVFRDRIKNERAVELCFEGNHYWCDIRRWKDAPAIGRSTLYGMRATKLDAASAAYPTGFKYERFALPANRQISWKNDGMYWFRFQDSDLLKMKNYTPKPVW